MKEQSKFERKHFFIDRHFQGRYMLTFLVPMLIMLLFLLAALYFAGQSLSGETARIVREDVDATLTMGLQDRTDPAVSDYRAVIVSIQEYLRSFSDNARYRKALMGTLLVVAGCGLVVVIIQIVLLTVFFSHKIAGPVYRLERSFRQVLEGDCTVQVHLRKGDELQNLAGLFNNMVTENRRRLRLFSEGRVEEAQKGLRL